MKFAKQTHLVFNYFRYYGKYLEMKKILARGDFKSKQELEEYQFSSMKRMITHAYETVPYYQKLFNEIGFHPDSFKSLEDLKRIPYLTKKDIQSNQQELLSTAIAKRHIKKVQTGGTTGMPTEFVLDNRYSSLIEMVFLRHMWKGVGYHLRDKCLVLREDTVEKIVEGKKYWKRKPITNWLIMSAYHLNADTIELYYKKILTYQPKFILAFPSNALLLARFIKDKNLKPISSLKAVICSSENLYDWQRSYLSDVFQAQIYSFYGHSEKCILATGNPNSGGYEFYPQYGHVELVNEKDEYCTSEDESGEIIATGFHNFVSPLIRYKTDDIGLFTTLNGSSHPHWFKIKRIEGRKQEFLIDKDHVQKTYMHIDRPFWEYRDKVLAYQYVQNIPGEVILNIHSKEPLLEKEIENIHEIFNETYFKFDLEIRQVDNIPRTGGGKFRYLVQNIKQL